MTHHLLPTAAELRASKPHLRPVVSLRDSTGTERVVYGLQPKQWEAFCLTPLMRQAHEPGPVHIGYGGAAFGGKSTWARAVVTAVAFRWPGSISIIFRETETEVRRNHVDRFFLEVPQTFEGQRIWTWNGQDNCITWFNGSKTYFGYLKHDHDVRRYQGPSFDCMVFEEATHFSWFQIAWLTGNRLRSNVAGSVPFAGYPSNPGNQGMAWYKRLFVQRRFRGEERPGDYAFVQALLKDNLEGARQDPSYARKLDLLPEPHRSWQRDGNFAAGAGSALSMLDWKKHLVRPFRIPDYWLQFGSFDWGYHHPFAFGWYAVNEDGTIYKAETVTGIRLKPELQAERIKSIVPVAKLKYITAGHDAWAARKALGEDTPSVQEQFAKAGILLSQANTDRKQGLQELRKYLDWTTSGPIIKGRPTDGDPQLLFFDTPNNRRCLEQLENMVADPTDLEDVLKVDADDFGEGGDDLYDETRYAVASRPMTPRSPWREESVDAWAPEALEAEARAQHKSRRHGGKGKGPVPEAVT